MIRHLKLKFLTASVASFVLAGCAVTQEDVNSAYDVAHRAMNAATANGPESMALVEDVPNAFLGDRLVPVAYEAGLPAVFRDKNVTFPANIKLRTLATMVSSATGYPVHLSSDVFIPRDTLIPHVGSDGKGAGLSLGKTSEEPVYAQPFAGNVGMYLRNVTEDLGLDWSFDGSTINVTRFVTRMFQIAAIPGKVSIRSTMSKGMDTSTGNQANGSGGSSGGNTGSFSAITSTGREGEFDQMKIIGDALGKLKSPMGNIVVNPQSRLVMVYDTKEAADRMGQFLTRENAISTRQVAVRVRTLQIALNNGSQAGLNADVVFNSIQGGLAKYAISFTSPTSLS